MYEIIASKIISSKLYKSSKRKNAILNAIQDPKNAGLMTQLAEYLDEEYQTPENLEGKPEVQEAPEGKEGGEEIRPSEGGGAGGGGGAIAGLGDGMSLMDTPETEEDLDALMSEEGGSDEGADLEGDDGYEPVDDTVEESTQVTKQKITACEDIAADQLESLKSSLNLVEETKGVTRISIKNNELWLYYNDDINLNNIMTDVIESVSSLGIDWAEFNRLARSDNAIVFEIVVATVSEPEPSEEKE